jgi:hypothetical protein
MSYDLAIPPVRIYPKKIIRDARLKYKNRFKIRRKLDVVCTPIILAPKRLR